MKIAEDDDGTELHGRVALLPRIREVPVQNSARRSAILTEVFVDFLSSSR
jgi:hypothetical protein